MKTCKTPDPLAFPITGTETTTTTLAAKLLASRSKHRHALPAWAPRALLPLLTVLMLPLAAQAQFQYSIANGMATITGYTGPGGNVVIPGTLGGFPVTAIGDDAFPPSFPPFGPTSVTIPDSVVSIGARAFAEQHGLTSISLGNGLVSIGESAFAICLQLTSISLPASVTTIGSDAFAQCVFLSSFTVNPGNSTYSSLSGVLFNKSQTALLQYPMNKAGSAYIIPGTVTAIGDNAFRDCQNLASINIPAGVTDIGSSAFSGARLTSVSLPDGITVVSDWTFSGCSSLTNVTLPDSVTAIGNSAFSGSGLTSVSIPDTVTSIGSSAYRGCTSLTNISFPSGVTDIADNLFRNCSSLGSVTIPDHVTAIGESAFESCTALTVIAIPDSVTSIDIEAFRSCTALTNASIGNGVTAIPIGMFRHCANLTSVNLPASLKSIGGVAFYQCWSLNSILIPAGVTNIGGSAFYSCAALANIFIPASVTSIGSYAFAFCSSLSNITVDEANPAYRSVDGVLFDIAQTTLIQYPLGKPESHYAVPDEVTSIEEYAFGRATNLISVAIPGSVNSLGNSTAFNGATGLQRVYFAGDAPPVAAPWLDPFEQTPATLYYLPGTTGWTSPFHGHTAVLWNPHIVTDDSTFGVHGGHFGFTFVGTNDIPVAIEACSDLANPDWTTITNLTCGVDGTVQFTDPEAADQPVRIYRFRPE